MAVLIQCKSEEQKQAEAQVIRDFGGDSNSAAHREAAEAIARYTQEQVREIERQEVYKR